MMKPIIPAAFAAAVLSACAASDTTDPTLSPAVGAANPASVFCEQQGGKSVIRKNQDGSEYGMCVFADGREMEEWAYFRANNS